AFMTLAKYNTKNGSPNDRRKRKRALEQELEDLRIKSRSDKDLHEELDLLENEESE
ncbi:MAG: hypothetical protein HOJ78_06000, partial [Gammaproteobacteria bacterium]|nr:hypothetical protein [Gammaproteobacteria bacterium]